MAAKAFRRGAFRNVVARRDTPVLAVSGRVIIVRNDLTLSCGHKLSTWNLPATEQYLHYRCFGRHAKGQRLSERGR
jgi:hypothetical protein